MLKALRSRGPVADIRTKSMPAPIGGWNARDALADMKPDDAVILDNYFPKTSEVELRYGNANFVTGITGTVNTLAAYNSPTTSKLFGAAGVSIYDVSAAGTVGAAVATGFTSDKWQTVNFATSGGNFQYWANGADKMELYDGSTWKAIDGTTTPAITGVTTSLIIGLNAFKERLWLVEKGSLRVWYLPVKSIGGAASALDFSSVFKNGGYLMAMGTWSLDAGQGLDDYAAFITSQGQVAIYKGTDPASASTWALVGVFDIGSPIGRRCFVKYAGDLLLINRDGLVPLSKALMSTRVNSKAALTDKIQQATSDATTAYAGNFGWQTILYPSENMLLMNVPVSSTLSYQYVMNTITGSWCRFMGWNATCWEIFNDQIYFGAAGKVCLAWSGQDDNGANINGEALQAFSSFGAEAILKQWTMVRPILSVNGNPGISIGVNVDFDLSAALSIPSFSPSSTAIWGLSKWGAGLWGGAFNIKKDWLTVTSYGYYGAVHMVTATKGLKLKWASTDFMFKIGAYL